MNWWVFSILMLFACFSSAFVFYWIGRSKSEAEMWAAVQEAHLLRRQNYMLQQRISGLKHELEEFYPSRVWPPKNSGWSDRHYD